MPIELVGCLEGCLLSPSVLCGGGCAETVLAHCISCQVSHAWLMLGCVCLFELHCVCAGGGRECAILLRDREQLTMIAVIGLAWIPSSYYLPAVLITVHT